MMKQKIQLAVIFYGDQGQYKINRQQFDDLKQALSDFVLRKYDFNTGGQIALLHDFQKGLVDMVLKNSYGRGHEAVIESWLELHKIPFLGSGATATFVATDKFLSKQVFRAHKIPIAKDIFIDKWVLHHDKTAILRQIKNEIGFPCVIKDTAGTDSRGIYLVKSFGQCATALEQAVAKYESVIVEEYINPAHEVTCFVVGDDKLYAYEPVGLKNKGAMLSGTQKDALQFTPAVPVALPYKIVSQIKQFSILAHQSLRCRTFSRADFLVKNRRLHILEVDVHPGFRYGSATTLAVQYEGQDLNQLFLMFCKKYARTPALR